METEPNQGRNLHLLIELEQRISTLLEDHGRLTEENQLLKQQQEKLALEKAGLHEKHRQIHSKIEAMLMRLKTLEQQ